MSEEPTNPENESGRSDAGLLEGLRVLELGEEVAAPYCAKLLADLGADVIKIERREGGDPSRLRGPLREGALDPECSGTYLYLNTSKRSIQLDLEDEADRALLAALVARTDVLIEDRAPGVLAALDLAPASLCERHPGLIVTSITPFGQDGPNAAHRSRHLNLYHAGGHASPFASLSGDDRAPARGGGQLAEYDAGLTAALGTLAAVLGRARTGRGQHVDCSKQEAMMCLERVTIGRFANEPDPFSGSGGPGGLSRAKDGWVMLTTLEPHQWQGLLRAMGNPAWADEEWCQSPESRMANMEKIAAHKDAWGQTLEREALYHMAQAEGTPAAPVRDVAEVMAWRQPNARGFFREVDHPRAGRLQVPTMPYRFSNASWVGRRAPLLGEHDQAIRDELEHTPARPATQPTATPNARPLEGIRVCDFTWAWAGPQGSLLLAMLGAEVIKVESRSRFDHARVHSLTAGSLQGGIDASPVFNDLNLGKRSVTLNLRSEEGRATRRRIAAGRLRDGPELRDRVDGARLLLPRLPLQLLGQHPGRARMDRAGDARLSRRRFRTGPSKAPLRDRSDGLHQLHRPDRDLHLDLLRTRARALRQRRVRTEQLGIVLAVWALQLAWSPWWLARFRFGPLEWLWRTLVYLRPQPFSPLGDALSRQRRCVEGARPPSGSRAPSGAPYPTGIITRRKTMSPGGIGARKSSIHDPLDLGLHGDHAARRVAYRPRSVRRPPCARRSPR